MSRAVRDDNDSTGEEPMYSPMSGSPESIAPSGNDNDDMAGAAEAESDLREGSCYTWLRSAKRRGIDNSKY